MRHLKESQNEVTQFSLNSQNQSLQQYSNPPFCQLVRWPEEPTVAN